jgi:type I restriction enzyme S subunit
MSDELIELPKDWEQVRLGDIIHPSDEKVEPTSIQSIPYVGLEHMEKDTGELLGYGNSSDVKSTKSKFYSGDLLYGKLRPYLNKVSLVDFEGVCSTDILVFSKSPYISNKFLAYRFLSRDFVSYASQNVNGVQHPRVNFQTLAEFSISLPPLNEQKRIVAKIEELRDRSHRAKQALEAIPELCDRFRQSVLAAAFRGDLGSLQK